MSITKPPQCTHTQFWLSNGTKSHKGGNEGRDACSKKIMCGSKP